MKNCDIVKDLIPLYIEDLTTEESSNFVKEHLYWCKDCYDYYEQSKEDFEKSKNEHLAIEEVVTKVSKDQLSLKLIIVLCSIFIANALALTNGGLMTTIPFLVLIPLGCRLIYKDSKYILIASFVISLICSIVFPLGYVMRNMNYKLITTSTLEDIHTLEITIGFSILALICSVMGVISAVFIEKIKMGSKSKFMCSTVAIASLFVGIILYSIFASNPISYVYTYCKNYKYLSDKYEIRRIKFISLYYDAWEKAYVGKYYDRYRMDEFGLITRPSGAIEDENYKRLVFELADYNVASMFNVLVDSNLSYSYIDVHWNAEEMVEKNSFFPWIDESKLNLEIVKTHGKGEGGYIYEHYIDFKEANKLNFSIIYFCNEDMAKNSDSKDIFIEESRKILKVLKDNNQLFNELDILFKIRNEQVMRIKINPNMKEELVVEYSE